MVVGELSTRTQVAVIGAGPGGYVAALRAADAGLDVTLIERSNLGGTCLNIGCIPSKTLIEVANVRHRVLASAETGLTASVEVDPLALTNHQQSVVGKLRGGVDALLRNAGVQVVKGTANFARYDRLSIAHDDQVSHLEFDDAIVATGSRPLELPNFPVGGNIVNSTGALTLSSVPTSMVIIGGGYIGVELGTAWAKLGASVTIIEAADTILPATAAALRDPVIAQLKELAVTVLTGAQATAPTTSGLVLSTGKELDADVIVVAIGRRPNSDQASLDKLDIELDGQHRVIVDDQMRATSGVYAIGDLVPGPALAHKATAQAEVAVEAIAHGHASFSPAAIPEVIFSDPEIMSVGVPLDAAPTAGVHVHRFPHLASARAQTIGESTGATFVVVDDAGTIVGVHAVGPHVSELAGEATLAIEMAATIEDVSLTIHPHPTLSESIGEAAWLARGMPLHIRR